MNSSREEKIVLGLYAERTCYLCQEMLSAIEKFAQHPKHQQTCCSVLAVLSHGRDGAVFGELRFFLSIVGLLLEIVFMSKI